MKNFALLNPNKERGIKIEVEILISIKLQMTQLTEQNKITVKKDEKVLMLLVFARFSFKMQSLRKTEEKSFNFLILTIFWCFSFRLLHIIVQEGIK